MASPASPSRHSHWRDISWIMLTDVVGTSVLTLPGVAAKLGWVLTVVLILGLCPVSIYSAKLMVRARRDLSETHGKEPRSMGDAAKHLFGGSASVGVYVLVYLLFGFFGNASYLMVLGKTLQGLFYDFPLCLPRAVFWSCVCCLPIVISVRRLFESVNLCFMNLFLMLTILIIVFSQLASDGRGEDVQTVAFAEGVTFMSVWPAVANIMYSYTGHWLYFELMAEMKNPDDFLKVFYINAPLQTGLYLGVACLGYYYTGSESQGYLLDNLPKGLAYRVASALLFCYVIVAFLIKHVVLSRFLHGWINANGLDEKSWRARMEFSTCSVVLLAMGYVVANAIPFFDDMLALIGSLFGGPISFLLPMLFFVCARCCCRRQESDLEVPLVDSKQRISSIPKLDVVVMLFIICVVGMTTVVGTTLTSKDIIAKAAKYGAPFSCHALLE